MVRKILILAMFILMFSFAYAEDVSIPHSCDELVAELDNYDIEIPKVLGYSNERFAITIENESGFVIVENRKVVDAGCNVIEDPTYTIAIDSWGVVDSIAGSPDYIDNLNEAISNGDIDIKAYSFTKKVKTFFGLMGLKIVGWFR